jgi:PHS family inorganic phosphate transporter-like MFS transporter
LVPEAKGKSLEEISGENEDEDVVHDHQQASSVRTMPQ